MGEDEATPAEYAFEVRGIEPRVRPPLIVQRQLAVRVRGASAPIADRSQTHLARHCVAAAVPYVRMCPPAWNASSLVQRMASPSIALSQLAVTTLADARIASMVRIRVMNLLDLVNTRVADS